jgi:hypothetical protein
MGWKDIAPLIQKVTNPFIDGILVIQPGLFACANDDCQGQSTSVPASMMLFTSVLHASIFRVMSVSFDPMAYIRGGS